MPFFPEALELASLGLLPGGSVCNRNHYLARARLAPGLEDLRVALTFDAQTSGGLILGVPQHKLAEAQAMLTASGDLSVCIGRATAAQPGGPYLSIV